MNERHADAATDTELSMECECECHRAECGSNFTVRLTDYETVRAEGRRFLVFPEHQHEAEIVVVETVAYWVIEKTGEQGEIAETLDPR